jgi:hypothetical protein
MAAEWECYLEKALECLRSAQISQSQNPKMCNCAANRSYYAAYLAELAALQKLDPLKLPDQGWRHPTVVHAFNFRLVRKAKIFKAAVIEDVSYLESQRIKGDYKAEHVSEADAVECYRRAKRVVEAIRRELEK